MEQMICPYCQGMDFADTAVQQRLRLSFFRSVILRCKICRSCGSAAHYIDQHDLEKIGGRREIRKDKIPKLQ